MKKKIYTLLFFVLLCCYAILIKQCCSKNDIACSCPMYTSYYTSDYVAISDKLPFNKMKKDGNTVFSTDNTNPDDVSYTSGRYTKDYYRKLFNDNKNPFCGGGDFIVITDTILSINVISDKNYDTEHPAGTYLDDIMTIQYYDIKEFVKNDYPNNDTESQKYRSKKLKQFNNDSLSNYLIGIYINIKFDKPSLSDSQTFMMIYKGREGGETRIIKKTFN